MAHDISSSRPSRPARTLATLAGGLVLIGGVATFAGSGSTAALGLLAICGLVALAAGAQAFTPLERTTARVMAGLYALVLGVDLLNGGGLANFERTGLNYLPVLLIAPCAVGVRLAGFGRAALGRIVMATLLFAALYTAARFAIVAQGGWELQDGRYVMKPGWNFRVDGINMKPGPFAFAILTWALLLMHLTLAQGRGMGRALVVAGLALLAVILTGSKSALLAAFAGAGLVGLGWVRATRPPARHLALFGALAALALAAAYLFLNATGRIDEVVLELDRFVTDGVTAGNSAGPRIAKWAAGLRAFAEAPVLGHGLKEMMAAAQATQPEGALNLLQYAHLHNDYLQHMVAFGAFGLVFLVLFFGYTLWLARQVADPALRGFAVSFVAVLLVYMAAEVAFNMGPMTGLMGLVLGLVLAHVSTPYESAQ